MIDLLDNAIGVGGPDKGSGFAIVLAKVAVDRRLEIDERTEDATPQAAAGERGEKGFDRIGPGTRGWREVKGPARVPGEPSAHFWVLVARFQPRFQCGCIE